ncbi:MAG: cyclase family protein [Verrucomicrobiota bacterium]|nr:cyclase family protein [Verrucomicrobiota bacterium]
MKKRLPILTLLALAMALGQGGTARAADSGQGRFVDLSLIVAENYPCTWATGFPRFYMNRYIRIGPSSPYNSDLLQIDGNTGTQIDVPPHSIPRPGSGLKNAGPLGLEYTDRTPAWKLVGEACVIDVTALLDQAPNGVSPLVKKEHIIAWEKKHRPLGQGDIVLLWSGYSDKYYRPMPEGRRFLALPLEKKTPAWPDPDPECMAYMAKKGVTAVGCDSPTMGPMPDLAATVHDEGLLRGLVFTEGATNLRKLPPTGAFYCMMGPRHFEGPYGEGRAFAIVGGQAQDLIKAAHEKRVADLSVVMAANHPLTWPGRGVSRHRHPYTRADFFYEPALDIFHHTHLMDSHAGTHLVPPAYALPGPGFKNKKYSPEVRQWLKEYEGRFGKRGTSRTTVEKVPLAQTSGNARVIDVRPLVGTAEGSQWPASPVITTAHIEAYEKKTGKLAPGDVVLFRTGHVDAHFKPLPEGKACMENPINGLSEGWPAPDAETIQHLAKRGIRCVGTDAPTLGGVDPKQALFTYWMLGTQGMVGVEFLTGLGQLPAKAVFLFAPVKIKGCLGGPGRAIAFY